jgi:predicted nuclease of predicted toxin-antitoxin system
MSSLFQYQPSIKYIVARKILNPEIRKRLRSNLSQLLLELQRKRSMASRMRRVKSRKKTSRMR